MILDWANAVRFARGTASAYAANRAEFAFLREDWRPIARHPVISVRLEEPPRGGNFRGYRHAARAHVVLEWRPLFRQFLGDRRLITGSSTAAVLQAPDGKWTPLIVE
jgi:hypothetical protein